MPQDSIAPDLPSVGDLAQEVEDEPILDDIPIQRHVIVENLLRDVVLFAQDFIDVVDELADDPIIQPAIHFPRPQRPAGRFMLGAGRRNINPRPAARPGFNQRPGWLGRRYQRHHYRENPRPGDVPLRPAGLLGRPANPEGDFGEPARPGQQPFDVLFRLLRGPDDVDQQEPPAIGDAGPVRQVADVEVEPHGPAAAVEEAEPAVQADAEVEPDRFADAEEEVVMQAVEAAESDMVEDEAAKPGVAGEAAAAESVTGKTAEAESDVVAEVESDMAAAAAEAESDTVAKAESHMAATEELESVMATVATEAESDMAEPDIATAAAEAECDIAVKAEPDMAAAKAESGMVSKSEPDMGAEAKSDMAENAEVELRRSTDVKPETCSPVTVEESEPVRTEMVEGQLDTPTTSGAGTTNVLAKGAEAAGSATTREPTTSMPVTPAHECPVPVKRARMNKTEAACPEQFEDDSDDKAAEDSSKPKEKD